MVLEWLVRALRGHHDLDLHDVTEYTNLVFNAGSLSLLILLSILSFRIHFPKPPIITFLFSTPLRSLLSCLPLSFLTPLFADSSSLRNSLPLFDTLPPHVESDDKRSNNGYTDNHKCTFHLSMSYRSTASPQAARTIVPGSELLT